MTHVVALVISVALVADSVLRQAEKRSFGYPIRVGLGIALAASGLLVYGSIVAAAELVAGAERKDVASSPTYIQIPVHLSDVAVALVSALAACQAAADSVRWALRVFT